MGTPLDWKFFTLKKKSHFHLLQGQTRAQKKSSSELDARYPIPNCFSPWSFLTHIKNPMGLEGFLLMESLFVGQKKVLCMASCSFGTLTDIPLGFRLSQSPIDTIPPGGFGGAEPPQGVDPLPSWLWKKSEVPTKSFFDLAENYGASKLWVRDHRYSKISCASKLLWV